MVSFSLSLSLLTYHILATDGSMRGGAPRPNLVAMAVVNRSGSSYPAEGGGEGIAVTGATRKWSAL